MKTKRLHYLFKRYFVDAMSAMALGLFSSLIIGLIITQLSKIPFLNFLEVTASLLGATSPVCGASIGIAIAYGLKCDPLVMFSSVSNGALGYALGGPVGAYIATLIGIEVGQIVSKKTPVDIIVTPFVTIVVGGLAANLIGPYISLMMTSLGNVINEATVLAKVPMGFSLGALVGMVLTLPISSAALCIMLNLTGLAAGAATVGCCAQMIGFAVISYEVNGFGGFMAQGIGTSMLQIGNIVKKPLIWIPPTIAGGICGVLSCLLGMQNIATGAGMGTSGLVGQITTYITMSPIFGSAITLLMILGLHFILPAIISYIVYYIMKKYNLIDPKDLLLEEMK